MQDKNKKSELPAKNTKAGNSKKNKKIIIISAILLVAFTASILLTVFLFKDDEFNFDSIVSSITYGGEDNEKFAEQIAEYVYISPEHYKSFPISDTLSEYKEIDLVRKINSVLVKNKSKEAEYDGKGKVSVPISLGDVVSLYFRGYTVSNDGKQTPLSDSCNYSEDTPVELEIGSGGFVPGFEDALIGVLPSDYERFFKITSGSVLENYVVYISYFSSATGYGYEERVDLSDPDIDKRYGEGFRNYLLAAEIGVKQESKVLKIGEGKSAGYHDLTVQYATDCESNPLTIDVTFPTNYKDASFRGVKAKFDVFIKSTVVYNVPEFNEEFITKTLGIKDSDLKDYSGSGTVEKYKSLLREEIEKEIKKSNDSLIQESMWAYYKAKATVKSLPENEVLKYDTSFYNEVINYYNANSASFSGLDECATTYLGLNIGADWRAHIRTRAESTVTEKLIFYYIILKENFIPTEKEYAEIRADIYEENYQYYLDMYSEKLKDLKGDAYDAFIKDLKADIDREYTDIYYRSTAQYEFGTEKLLSFAKIQSGK